jgi:3-hydroxyacyl-CoA dehydrogenase
VHPIVRIQSVHRRIREVKYKEVKNKDGTPAVERSHIYRHGRLATPEAVDEVFELGMAHPMGPLTLADFIRLDVCLDIMRLLLGAVPRSDRVPLLISEPASQDCQISR